MQKKLFSYLFYGSVVMLGLYIIGSNRFQYSNDWIFIPLLVLSIVFFIIYTYLKKR